MDVVWIALYIAATLGLVAYGVHAMVLLRGAQSRGPRYIAALTRLRAAAQPQELPRVLVQLPVFEEPRVVGRLVEAVAALDWPADRLTIQLLDDSQDTARTLGAAAVAAARARGVSIQHLCRPSRTGYTAGALAHGLLLSPSSTPTSCHRRTSCAAPCPSSRRAPASRVFKAAGPT